MANVDRELVMAIAGAQFSCNAAAQRGHLNAAVSWQLRLLSLSIVFRVVKFAQALAALAVSTTSLHLHLAQAS